MCYRLLLFFCVIQVLSAVHGNLLGLPKLCFCRCGTVENSNYPYQFPWMAMINTGGGYIEGALISDQHVITAASPLYGVPVTNVTVTLGAYDRCSGQTSMSTSASSIVINPGYAPSNLHADLALIKLRSPVAFTSYISPICLPYWGLHESGKVGWTSGWQLNSNSATCIPRVGTFPLLSYRTCASSRVATDLLTEDKGCFGPLTTICNLDVGAPVMWRWVEMFPFRLIGIVSTTSSCENNISPLYTRVVDHLSWIYDNIRTDCLCI